MQMQKHKSSTNHALMPSIPQTLETCIQLKNSPIVLDLTPGRLRKTEAAPRSFNNNKLLSLRIPAVNRYTVGAIYELPRIQQKKAGIILPFLN